MSYTNVNEAWLGFDDKYRGFEVNNYDPDSITDYIYVRSGTQSKDIEITPNNDYLAANKASITASENSFKESSGSLKFSSVYFDWTMFANESKIYFRVSADKSADRGLYYIDWTLDIENYSNGSTTYYNPPVKTLVEVDHLAKASFTVTPNSGVTV